MVKTIDYAGYPHIFEQVIRYCDLGTQKTLRLLSTVAKTAVDRAHARLLYLWVFGQEVIMCTVVSNPGRYQLTPPFLTGWDGHLSDSPDERVEFALTNAHRVSVRDSCLIDLCLLESKGRPDLLGLRDLPRVNSVG